MAKLLTKTNKTVKKQSLNLLFILFLIISIIVGTVLVRTLGSTIGISKAWDCRNYRFNVTREGQVSVINGSTRAEPSQLADVYINRVKVATLSVPALLPGATAVIGQVNVDSGSNFEWVVDGSKDCISSGTHEGLCNFTEVKLK